MYTGLGLTTQGEAQGFLKRNGTYAYVEAQKFLVWKRGYGTYTHKEAQKVLEKEIETSRHL